MVSPSEVPAFIKKRAITPREYQINIYKAALKENTMVILPTGLGKTVIAALVAAKRFEQYPDKKVVMLAPTRPLAEQHASTFKELLDFDEFRVLTGETDADARKWYWNHSTFLFMTPQALRNDLEDGRYDLSGVSLLIFDEAHHAVGNYPYVAIAKAYVGQASDPLILGLTASPGYSREHLNEVLSNLFITHVEARDESSPDVAPYVNQVLEQKIVLTLPPEITEVSRLLEELESKYINRLQELGIRFKVSNVPMKYLLNVQDEMRRKIEAGEADPQLYYAYGLLNNVIRVKHARLLLEVEGVSSALGYMKDLGDEVKSGSVTRSLRMLANDKHWQEAERKLLSLKARGTEHPKVKAVMEVVSQAVSNGLSKVLVFTHYRETAKVLSEELASLAGVRPAPFLGQAKKGDDRGMSQRDQVEVLEKFREGTINVLVATQVAEEGLDIENCDLVVFYDNVPSAIRLIQRRGRTGRKKEGKIVVLIAKGTPDETYHWLSIRREGTMDRLISSGKGVPRKVGLDSFLANAETHVEQGEVKINKSPQLLIDKMPVSVTLDNSLSGKPIADELKSLGISYETKDLGGEYIKVKDVVVRVIACSDVFSALSSGSLFEEAIFMKTMGKPIFIIEGNPPLIGSEEAGPRSSLLSISLKYGVPFVPSSGPKDSALYVFALAKRADE